MISLKSHGALDYVLSVVLVLSPFLFGFASVDAARNVFVVVGFVMVVYSLFTSYHASLVRAIPLGVHMMLDLSGGMLIAAAPFLFKYRDAITPTQELAHYGVGVVVLAMVGLTKEKTESDKRAHHVRLRPMATQST